MEGRLLSLGRQTAMAEFESNPITGRDRSGSIEAVSQAEAAEGACEKPRQRAAPYDFCGARPATRVGSDAHFNAVP